MIPEDAFKPYVPEDFDELWASLVDEVKAVPLNFRRRPATEATRPGHRIERIDIAGLEFTCSGWIAIPLEVRKAPGFLWIPPYGQESLLPNDYGCREGMVSLSLNLLGNDAFHQEKYQPSRGYFARGIDDPRTWIFRRMLGDCLIAMRVLQAQIEADEDRLGVMGLSQGGGLAIWTGALSSIPRAVCADLPFLGTMLHSLSRNAYRYPLKEIVDHIESTPLGREMVMHTISYFDTMNFATRLNKPAQISLGLKDPACRPETVQAIYDAIPTTEKRLIEYEGGHDWDPRMIEANRQWLLSHF